MENMLPTKVCMSYKLPETVLFSGLGRLHLDLFQFLHRYLSLQTQFYYTFSKVKLPLNSGRQFFLFIVNQSINHLFIVDANLHENV